MAGYIGSKAAVVSSGAERKKTFDITGTTTSLTGLSYTVNQVHVFHNGVRLVDGTDFTATNGNSITLTSAAESGDEVVVVSYAGYQVSDTVSASQGGTFAGALDVNASSATVLTVDRTGSDGTILDLKKDGSTVGQIGTGLSGGSEFGIKSNTGELQLASSYNSNTVTWDGSQLYPSASNDLGASSVRWRDLYLSGGVYLGGVGSSNKLDDYEEGTFTPTVFDTNGNLTPTYVTANTFGRYTKIGQLVTIELEVRTSGTSGSKNGYLRLGGLPFNSASDPSQPSFIISLYNIAFNTSYLYTAEFLGAGSNTLYIRESRNNTTSGQMVSSAWSGNNPTLIRISGSYRTAS